METGSGPVLTATETLHVLKSIDIYYPCLHKTWTLIGIQQLWYSSGGNHFTFLDEELLPAVVEDGVGGVVGVHHTVVGLRSRVTLGNCSVGQEQLGEISSWWRLFCLYNSHPTLNSPLPSVLVGLPSPWTLTYPVLKTTKNIIYLIYTWPLSVLQQNIGRNIVSKSGSMWCLLDKVS